MRYRLLGLRASRGAPRVNFRSTRACAQSVLHPRVRRDKRHRRTPRRSDPERGESGSTAIGTSARPDSEPIEGELYRQDERARRLTVRIDFRRGTRFACEDGGAHPVHDTRTKRHRHLGSFQHECVLEAPGAPARRARGAGREALDGLFQFAKLEARGYQRLATIRPVFFLSTGNLDFSKLDPHAARPTRSSAEPEKLRGEQTGGRLRGELHVTNSNPVSRLPRSLLFLCRKIFKLFDSPAKCPDLPCQPFRDGKGTSHLPVRRYAFDVRQPVLQTIDSGGERTLYIENEYCNSQHKQSARNSSYQSYCFFHARRFVPCGRRVAFCLSRAIRCGVCSISHFGDRAANRHTHASTLSRSGCLVQR